MDDELLLFVEEPLVPVSAKGITVAPWKVLIVDDDEGVHGSTRFALDRVRVDGRALQILDAYSAEDARVIFIDHPDLALALVDVVMETERAGLDLARWVRNELNNRAVRLVLRTGQPGQAPERDVVVNFDIDDYKAKSELTSQKLFTLLHAALRSYQLIRAMERNRQALIKVIDASACLSFGESTQLFASGILEQVTATLNLNPGAIYCESCVEGEVGQKSFLKIKVGSGDFSSMIGSDPSLILFGEEKDLLCEAKVRQCNVFRDRSCATYFLADSGVGCLLFFTAERELSLIDQDLIAHLSNCIGRTFTALLLREIC